MKLDSNIVGKRCKGSGRYDYVKGVVVALSADKQRAFVDTRPDEPNAPARSRFEEVPGGHLVVLGAGQKVAEVTR